MPIDTSIYSNLLRPKSIGDYDAEAQAYKQNQLNQQLTQNDVNNLPLKNQLAQVQLQQAQLAAQRQGQMWQTLQPILQRLGGQTAPQGAPQSAPQGSPSPATGMPSAPAPGPSGQTPTMVAPPSAGAGIAGMPLTFNDVLSLKLSGGPDLTKEFQMALEGVSRAPGSEVTDVNGNRRMVPKIGEGQQIGADGSISNIPGYTAASAASAGAVSDAQEAAKSQHQLLPLEYRSADSGQPLGGTVGAYINPPAPPAPPPGFPAGTSASDAQRIISARTASGEINQPFSVNGQPVNLGPTGVMPPGPGDQLSTQQKLEAAKAGGPEAMARFTAEQIPRILSIPDPQNRATAYQNFQRAVSSPPGTPMGGTAPDRPQLQGPAQAAAQTLQATQEVHAATDPNIDLRKAIPTEAHKANQAAVTDLSDVVNNEAEIVGRNNRIAPLVSQLNNSGGWGYNARVDFANNLQNSGVLPRGISDAVSKWVAGGDPATAKVISNQLSSAAIQTMLDTLNKEGRPNKTMYTALHDQEEALKNGKDVLQSVMGLQGQLYQQHLGQLGTMTNLMDSPDYNPVTFPAQYANAKAKSVANPPPASPPAGLQSGSASPPANTNAQGWTLHRDAKGNQAYVSPDGKQFQEIR